MKDEPVLALRPAPGKGNTESAFGLTVQALTPDLAGKFEVEEAAGVIVTAVEEGSAAEQKGVQPGDIVTEMNRQPIRTTADFKSAVAGADAKKGVLVYLRRGSSSTFVVLKEK